MDSCVRRNGLMPGFCKYGLCSSQLRGFTLRNAVAQGCTVVPDGNPVFFPGRGDGYQTVAYVAQYSFRDALPGVAESAAAAGDDGHGIPLLQGVHAITVYLVLTAVGVFQCHPVRGRALSFPDTQGRGELPGAAAEVGAGDVVALNGKGITHPETTAPLAGAGAVRFDFIFD